MREIILAGALGWALLPWVLMVLSAVVIARLVAGGERAPKRAGSMADSVRRSVGERLALWRAYRQLARHKKALGRDDAAALAVIRNGGLT